MSNLHGTYGHKMEVKYLDDHLCIVLDVHCVQFITDLNQDGEEEVILLIWMLTEMRIISPTYYNLFPS
jgi:hypothetical protein